MSAPVAFSKAVPILRIFDINKARQFYVDYLGVTVDWEHRFSEDAPLYMQVSRGGMVLHLSEHHGDATPGSVVYSRPRACAPCTPSYGRRTTPTSIRALTPTR